jgi:hypothetical protein
VNRGPSAGSAGISLFFLDHVKCKTIQNGMGSEGCEGENHVQTLQNPNTCGLLTWFFSEKLKGFTEFLFFTENQ